MTRTCLSGRMIKDDYKRCQVFRLQDLFFFPRQWNKKQTFCILNHFFQWRIIAKKLLQFICGRIFFPSSQAISYQMVEFNNHAWSTVTTRTINVYYGGILTSSPTWLKTPLTTSCFSQNFYSQLLFPSTLPSYWLRERNFNSYFTVIFQENFLESVTHPPLSRFL